MLLMSLFAIPQMTAEVFTRRLKPMMAIAAAISMVCSVAGLLLAYIAEIPASATIVILLIAVYASVRLTKLVADGNKRQ